MADNTDVSICSYALTLLGLPPISSFSEESDIAAACSRIYPVVRDSVLASFNWRVAVKKRQLAKLSDETPLNEWDNIHALPKNMIEGPLALFGDDASEPSSQWEIYDGKIYSNFEKIIIDYTGRPSEALFPPLLVDFLGHAVASALALPLTESADKASEMRIKAYGDARLDGNGGLYVMAKRAVSQSQPTKSLFSNNDPLSRTRY